MKDPFDTLPETPIIGSKHTRQWTVLTEEGQYMNYKHIWSVSSDAKLVRLYAWAWYAEPRHADFCKLAWGLIFLPVALIIHFVEFIVENTYGRIPRKKAEPISLSFQEIIDREEADYQAGLAKRKKSEARLQKLVDKVTSVINFLRLKFVALGIALAVTVFAVGLIVYTIATNFIDFLEILAFLASGGVLSVVILSLVAWLGPKIAPKASSAAKTFGSGVVLFFKTIKYNTCPKIEVK